MLPRTRVRTVGLARTRRLLLFVSFSLLQFQHQKGTRISERRIYMVSRWQHKLTISKLPHEYVQYVKDDYVHSICRPYPAGQLLQCKSYWSLNRGHACVLSQANSPFASQPGQMHAHTLFNYAMTNFDRSIFKKLATTP